MRNALIKNTAILIASNIIVRFIGLAYKVWLSRSISSEDVYKRQILGQPQNIPSSFAEIPWLAMGLASWGLFGGAMGIIAVLADRE